MNHTKIQFSEKELVLVENAEWILTKNNVIRKICDVFGIMSEKMKSVILSGTLPPEVKQTTPKISKGENYQGLPYVVLDYPRLFTKENVFAIRVLFWWANYFSITLHLKGEYKRIFADQIRKNLSFFSKNDFYISITKDEWSHALHENQYVMMRDAELNLLQNVLDRHDFLKLSAKMELTRWNDSEDILLRLFKKIIDNIEM